MLRILCVALIGMTGACATAGASNAHPGDTTNDELVFREMGNVRLTHDATTMTGELPASRDKVWRALLLTNEELGLPLVGVDTIEHKAQYFLQAYNHRIAGKTASTYLDCGSGPMGNNADYQRVTVKLIETVQDRIPDRSVVRISLVASSKATSNSSDELACSTFGLLEKRIVELIASKLR